MRPCGAADVAANPSATPPVVGTQKCATPVANNLGSDPKIENFGLGCETTFTVTGNVETRVTVCDDGKEQKITKTRNNNGTTTIRVEYKPPTVPNDVDSKVASDITKIIAADGGQTTSGGDERGLQPQTTRISWRELIRP